MQQEMRLVLAGGGTGGHIVPNIVLIRELKRRYGDGSVEFLYIGGRNSMEEKMAGEEGVEFKAVQVGKVRRYFSVQNFLDPFLVVVGILQAWGAIRRFKPHAVFCKGGYASFPAAIGGWLARVPVVLHESDTVPGLANKVSARFARKVCVSFEESMKYFSAEKGVFTGHLVRSEMADGDRKSGLEFTGLKGKKTVLLFMGGSQGAHAINDFVWKNLEELSEKFEVVHLCGRGNVRKDLQREGYAQFEFVGDELKDLYAAADVIVTRSGAMTLAELELVGKPSVLIPLSKKASRGDQILNAESFANQHAAVVLEEEELEVGVFLGVLKNLLTLKVENRTLKVMGVDNVVSLLESL